jgi:glycosyltransferase involved in cell wall biosynthesis
MKIVQINTFCDNDSTGKICAGISYTLNSCNIENYIIYTKGYSLYSQGVRCVDKFSKIQTLKSRLFGNYGFNSKKNTERIINELERISPDIVHLHNLHGHDVHLERLFLYLKSKKIRIFWTFHDCWTFTGYCVYYDMVECTKWKNQCFKCPQKKKYSWFFDRSRAIQEKKKKIFSELDLTIITPSKWLAEQTKMSFLKKYPIHVIHNGINLEIFKPQETNVREKYNISNNKFIILGVASIWVLRKGADVFNSLAQRLDDRFQIVLVGTDDNVDKQLPPNIISIHRTANQTELAEIYTAADLFVNPTREENFPTVNIEALACGTPVLTYRTGGSPEMLDENSGMVVERNDEEALYNAIIEIERTRPFTAENCRKQAEKFSNDAKYREYVSLYKAK